jgi:hypothetical protein
MWVSWFPINLSNSLWHQVLTTNYRLPQPLFIDQLEKPLAQKALILDLQILYAETSLVFGLTYYIPVGKSIFPLLVILLPKKSWSKIINFFKYPLGISKKDSINIGKLLSTEFIRTNRPSTERYFPFELLSFFSILSSIIFQSLLLSFFNA